MILLFAMGGRTGNQLFQVAYALGRKKRNEFLVSVGFGHVRSLLEGPCRNRWLNIEGRLTRLILERFLQPIAYRLFVRTGVVASDYENLDTYEIKRGMVRRVRVMKGYFQSSERQSPHTRHFMRLNGRLVARARPILASVPFGSTPVFIHMRRSDFEGVIIDGHSIRLPDEYYLGAVRELREHHQGLFYIIVGDDPGYAERLFKDIGPKYVSRLSVQEDLALMSMCEGGILSNSTLSWWGAFFSSSRIGYLAPKYWSGWKVKRWLPPELHGSFVTRYVDVESN
jgi:hypothetical protein